MSEEKSNKLIAEHAGEAGICEGCGNDGASYGTNPYSVEINQEYAPCWLCSDCYAQYAGDI